MSFPSEWSVNERLKKHRLSKVQPFQFGILFTLTNTWIETWFRNYTRMICSSYVLIDLFTDKAAILNKLDLRNIMACPGGGGGGHEHDPFCIYERLSGHFFLEFDCNGKKDGCAV